MTRKVYKSAMGKTVDLGALLLQNEQVRAVGNMGVNAAGDLINSNNRVIDQKNRQVQRQYQKQTNVTAGPVPTSNLAARQMNQTREEPAPVALSAQVEPQSEQDIFEPPPVEVKPSASNTEIKSGGLAAAMARNREIKQELEKTRRQLQQEQGIKKI